MPGHDDLPSYPQSPPMIQCFYRSAAAGSGCLPGHFKGSSREHTESDLRSFLTWCADRRLDPLFARRPYPVLYIRWMQEIRRFKPWPPRPSTAACGWKPSRPARPPENGDDTHLREDRQPGLADEYAAVSTKIDALRAATRPPTTKPPAWPGCAAKHTPDARQRPVHPPRTRLPPGIRLRNLRLLPHRHRISACPSPPARPRPRPRPDRTRRTLQRAHPEGGTDPLTTITRIPLTRRSRLSVLRAMICARPNRHRDMGQADRAGSTGLWEQRS